MAKKICSVFLFFLTIVVLSSTNLFSQKQTALIKGKVIDEISASPIGASISFIPDSGRTIKCKSNSSDGAFQQVLEPFKHYSVIVAGYILTEQDMIINTHAEAYIEIEKEIKVKEIMEGMELYRFSLFKPNDSAFAESSADGFKDMKNLMDNNISVNMIVTVSTEDAEFSKKRVKQYYTDKRGRKKNKRVWLTVEGQATELLEQRYNALVQYFENHKKYNKRLTIEKKLIANTAKKKKKRSRKKEAETIAPPVPNIIITVGKIRKF